MAVPTASTCGEEHVVVLFPRSLTHSHTYTIGGLIACLQVESHLEETTEHISYLKNKIEVLQEALEDAKESLEPFVQKGLVPAVRTVTINPGQKVCARTCLLGRVGVAVKPCVWMQVWVWV